MKYSVILLLFLSGCESERQHLRKNCHLDNVTPGEYKEYDCTQEDCTDIPIDENFSIPLCWEYDAVCHKKAPDVECYSCDGLSKCINHGGYPETEKHRKK